MSGKSPAESGNAGNWRSWALLALLVLATAAKFAAFAHALSFGYWDRLKIVFGLEVSVVQAGMWWWMARGLGIAGVLGAWLLQSLYLAVCWSYFAYFGLHLMFATALSVGTEGMTAVGHGAIPLIVGMLWLLIDLPFVFAWCVADG